MGLSFLSVFLGSDATVLLVLLLQFCTTEPTVTQTPPSFASSFSRKEAADLSGWPEYEKDSPRLPARVSKNNPTPPHFARRDKLLFHLETCSNNVPLGIT